MASAEKLKPFILRWEGGFVNDPNDKGGATNKGVTIATFRHYYGASSTVAHLKNITDEQWLHIFKAGYWDRWRADDIDNQAIANIVVDWVWASGSYGITQVQKILGTSPDGIVGNKTITLLNARPADALFHQIRAARIAFVETIAKRNPSQRKFLQGWKNRIMAFQFEK